VNSRRVLSALGAVVVLMAVLSACGGSSSTPPAPVRTRGPASPTPSAAPTAKPTPTVSPSPTPSPTPIPAASGHLYVAGTYVERFPIAGGTPEETPDLVYPAQYSWPVAVDAQGNVYASELYRSEIAVFPPNSTTPSREITLSFGSGSPSYPQANGLAVSRTGYLYVSFYGVTESIPEGGVLIYGPQAQGDAPPVQTIFTAAGTTQFTGGGIALARTGEMLTSYQDIFESYVSTYRTPVRKPRETRQLTLPYQNASGLAIDVNRQLYVSTTCGSSCPEDTAVEVFALDADGPAKPKRIISIANATSFGPGIAISANVLFVTNPTQNSVSEVFSSVGGRQKPISTLVVPFTTQDVKVGP
jgi:hypothetical protein